MTKEIIIDGIDVSDCMYYEPKAIKMNCHEQAITKPCNTSPICYYKLLHKAYKNCECLEQENDRLKEEKDKYYQQTLDDEIKLNELYQVLQEIKKECHWTSECGVTNDNMWGYERILDLITKAEEE